MKDKVRCDSCDNYCLDEGLPSGVVIKLGKKVGKHKRRRITMCVECWSFFVDQIDLGVAGSLINQL